MSSLPDRREVILPTGRLSYRQAGSGPDLVLLHGLAGNSGTWIRQFEYFTDRFQITAWDAPGYGCSDTVTPEIDVYGDVLGAFTASLGIHRFISVSYTHLTLPTKA